MRSAAAVYLAMSGASSLFFALIFTVNLVYQTETVGLNPFQLVLVGTVLEIAYFLAQIPTGVLADSFSRRRSVVIGAFLIGAGFLLEGSVPRFATVLLAQVIWGVGAAFRDGADAAWIADEIGEAAAGRLYLRGAQVGAVCGLLGIGASVALASLRLNLPILLGGALFMVLALYLRRAMPEERFAPAPRGERPRLRTMGATFMGGARLLRARPILITILILALIHGAYSEGVDRLWQYHFLHHFSFPALGHFKPVVWFGIISAGASLLGLGAAEIAHRRLDTTDHRATATALLAMEAAIAAGTIMLGLAGGFVMALAAYWIVVLGRSTRGPVATAWLNQSLEARTRATLLSLHGQADALGQIVCGPLLGLLATAAGTRAELVVAGLILVPALLLYTRTLGARMPD